MSVVDDFRQHPIHPRLKDLGQAIEGLTDERRAEAEGKVPGFLDRSTEVIAYLVERLELTDPRLITPARLASASDADAQLNAALSAIAGTAGTPLEDWPIQVDTALTSALDHLTIWPACRPRRTSALLA
jgi:hypothetical protein